MNRYILMMVMLGILIFPGFENALAEETVGCPHDVGKGKFKLRGKVAYTNAQKCYSDEVYKALHGDSPYSIDYDKMVDLPDGWHQKIIKLSLGLEYGIIDRLSVGVFLPYTVKDTKKQVWSKTANKTTWKEIKDNGLEDIWFSTKYLIFSKPPLWEDGLFLAIGYRGKGQRVNRKM